MTIVSRLGSPVAAVAAPASSPTSPPVRPLPEDEAASTFEPFMAATTAVAFVKDAAGRYVYMNDRFRTLFADRIGTDWLGKTDADLWSEDLAMAMDEADATVRTTHRPITVTQWMPVGDRRVQVRVTRFPIRSDGGTMIGGLGTDVDAESAATDALRRSQEILATATEVAGIGVWEFDGVVRMANAVSTGMEVPFGPSADAPAALETLLASVHPDDRQMIMDATAEALREGRTLERDFRIRTLDGNERWLRTVAGGSRASTGCASSGSAGTSPPSWRRPRRSANRR